MPGSTTNPTSNANGSVSETLEEEKIITTGAKAGFIVAMVAPTVLLIILVGISMFIQRRKK